MFRTGEHKQNLKHRHYEKMKNQITDMNVESEDEQLKLATSKALENPTKAHPLSIQQEIFHNSQGKLSHCVKKTKIQNVLSSVRRELFLPPTELKACKLLKTYSGELLCPQVNFIVLFSLFLTL